MTHRRKEKGKRNAKPRLTQCEEDQIQRILARFGRLSEEEKGRVLEGAKKLLCENE